MASCVNLERRSRSEISKDHSDLIRAITCVRLAYRVDICGMTGAIGVIGVKTVVKDGYDQPTVTIDVDAV